MFNIREKIRRWVLQTPREVYPQETGVLKASATDHLLQQLPQAMLVHPIANGYILRIDTQHDFAIDRQARSIIYYAKDETEVAEQIVAHQARIKLGIDPATDKQGDLFTAAQMGSARTQTPTKGRI